MLPKSFSDLYEEACENYQDLYYISLQEKAEIRYYSSVIFSAWQTGEVLINEFF